MGPDYLQMLGLILCNAREKEENPNSEREQRLHSFHWVNIQVTTNKQNMKKQFTFT